VSDVLRYTRVDRTGDGGSAFADVESPLTERRVADGVPAMFTGELSAEGVTFLRSAAFDSEAHPAPREQWVVLLRGVLEVEVTDGTRRRFGPGDLLYVTDTTGRGHVTRAVGDPPFEALFVPVEEDVNGVIFE
jgi:quercetin dioxygenase-like cupin family protein